MFGSAMIAASWSVVRSYPPASFASPSAASSQETSLQATSLQATSLQATSLQATVSHETVSQETSDQATASKSASDQATEFQDTASQLEFALAVLNQACASNDWFETNWSRPRFGFGGAVVRRTARPMRSSPTPTEPGAAAGSFFADTIRSPFTWSGVQLG